MKDHSGKYLLELSRETISRALAGSDLKRTAADLPPDDEAVKDGACFVTLTKHGDLRGCIGSLQQYRPLYKDVISNSLNAAFKDPRFGPVTEKELKDIRIEISVLSEKTQVEYKDYDELKKLVIPEKHGVYLTSGYHSATFLPQVWEQLPDHDLFFGHLCNKAGLDYDHLKTNKAKIEVYTVEKFQESV